MAKQLGKEALVVGAGIAGLAAAAALARHFARVTILDRDSVADGASPRGGVGQSAHTHQLLKGGEEALETLLPGFVESLYRAGGAALRAGRDVKFFDFGGMMPDCDAGFDVTAMSRPLYEKTLRDAVLARGNVELRAESGVKRFIVEGGRCIGVELEDGARLNGDLVVDATGMMAPLAAQLVQDGHAEFETESVKINVGYVTGRFKQPAAFRGERLGFFVLPGPPDGHFGLMLPIENDEWIVSLGGRGAHLPPRDLAGFREYASHYPTPHIFERISGAEPTTDLKLFRKTFATRRRFDKAAAWPDRLIPVGDAMSSVNPTYGQGMSIAAMQAAELDRQLAGRDGLDGISAAFIKPAFEISERAWGLALNSDYVYPETEGPRPGNFQMSRTMAVVLRKLAQEDLDFRIFRIRFGHLLESGEALRQGPLAMRFFTALQGSMAPGA